MPVTWMWPLPFARPSSKTNTLYVQAAAGVVADSVPKLEWRETEHKARALLRASELVEEGLE
jgi:anthranilate synthase component 1